MFNNKLYNCLLIYSFICNSAFTGEANLCGGDKVNLDKTFYELNWSQLAYNKYDHLCRVIFNYFLDPIVTSKMKQLQQ